MWVYQMLCVSSVDGCHYKSPQATGKDVQNPKIMLTIESCDNDAASYKTTLEKIYLVASLHLMKETV